MASQRAVENPVSKASKSQNKGDKPTSVSMSSRVEFRARLPSGQSVESRGLWNISLGGIFLEMSEPLPFGSDLLADISLPVAPRNLRCKGYVVWTTRTNPQKVKAKGISGAALRLTDIHIQEMRILAECIGRQLELG